MQALDEAEIVDHFRGLGEDLAHPLAGAAVLLPLVRAGHQAAGLGELNPWLRKRELLAMIGLKLRFVVKGVDLRWAAMHE